MVNDFPPLSRRRPVVAIPGKGCGVSGANLACVHRHTPPPPPNIEVVKEGGGKWNFLATEWVPYDLK